MNWHVMVPVLYGSVTAGRSGITDIGARLREGVHAEEEETECSDSQCSNDAEPSRSDSQAHCRWPGDHHGNQSSR